MRKNNPSTALSSNEENKGKRCEDGGSFTCFPHTVFILILRAIARPIPAHVEEETSGMYARLTERKPFTSCGGFSLLSLILYPPPLPLDIHILRLSTFSRYFVRTTFSLSLSQSINFNHRNAFN